jgi:hypothetical protein
MAIFGEAISLMFQVPQVNECPKKGNQPETSHQICLDPGMHPLHTIQWLKACHAWAALSRRPVSQQMSKLKPRRTDPVRMMNRSPMPEENPGLADKI